MSGLKCRLFPLAALMPVLLIATGCASAVPPSDGGQVPATSASGRAADPPVAATYPTELRGLWVGEHSSCPTQDSGYDGELILEISAERIVGYEAVRTPVSVVRLADGQSWRIESLLDVGPSGVFKPEPPEVFKLEGKVLTVADAANTERYRHCTHH